MTIRRQISCDIPGCAERYLETAPGEGWPNWCVFQGIVLNGVENPCLCPSHVATVADHVDSLKGS